MSQSLFGQTILVAGAYGMVGSALVQALQAKGCGLLTPHRKELDCTQQHEVKSYLEKHRPDIVVIAAAKVGGIWANQTYPAEFLYENLMIASNLIHGAHVAGIQKLLFLGSSCIYPKYAPQPIKEEALLTSALESTNEAYALAKIAGVKLCEYYTRQYGRSYISAMPTNLYGPKDNYHPLNAHVIPSLLLRFHEAKIENHPQVEIWGTGSALREFLYVEDLALACVRLLEAEQPPSLINIGSGEEISICSLAELIKGTVGYEGKIVHDLTKPDGTPRKLLDSSKIRSMGWEAKVDLRKGLRLAYEDFLQRLFISS